MDLTFADVKPSLVSFLVVGIMATLFILGLKWAVSKYPISGLTEFVNAI